MRFLHTSDWQLGMTRHFLSEDAGARYTEARFEAIRAIGRLAAEQACEFVVVAGDVFESNQVDRALIARALDAMAEIPVPVFLLPGNHDPLDASSIFTSPAFVARKPDNVIVLGLPDAKAGAPNKDLAEAADDAPLVYRLGNVEIIGAPWLSKRPLSDLVQDVYRALEPNPAVARVLVGHGAVDTLSPNPDDPALISVAAAEAALAAGGVDVICLGDRHSKTEVGSSGRIWYSGTQEVTDFDEVDPGKVLVIELPDPKPGVKKNAAQALPGFDEVSPVQQRGKPIVSAFEIGQWVFERPEFALYNDTDLDAMDRWFSNQSAKSKTVVKASLEGALTLAQKARLDEILDRWTDVFAAVNIWDRRSELAVKPDDNDFSDLNLSGFAAETLHALTTQADSLGDQGKAAQDALSLLYRLAERQPDKQAERL